MGFALKCWLNFVTIINDHAKRPYHSAKFWGWGCIQWLWFVLVNHPIVSERFWSTLRQHVQDLWQKAMDPNAKHVWVPDGTQRYPTFWWPQNKETNSQNGLATRHHVLGYQASRAWSLQRLERACIKRSNPNKTCAFGPYFEQPNHWEGPSILDQRVRWQFSIYIFTRSKKRYWGVAMPDRLKELLQFIYFSSRSSP